MRFPRFKLWKESTTIRVALVFQVDDMLAGTQQFIIEVLAELSRDMKIKSNEVMTKPTSYLDEPW